MMILQSLFIGVLNLSIAASFLMLAMILLRPFLKRLPKWFVCAMWAMVAVRLILPFSVESSFSLLPAWKLQSPSVEDGRAGNTDKGGALNAEKNMESLEVGEGTGDKDIPAGRVQDAMGKGDGTGTSNSTDMFNDAGEKSVISGTDNMENRNATNGNQNAMGMSGTDGGNNVAGMSGSDSANTAAGMGGSGGVNDAAGITGVCGTNNATGMVGGSGTDNAEGMVGGSGANDAAGMNGSGSVNGSAGITDGSGENNAIGMVKTSGINDGDGEAGAQEILQKNFRNIIVFLLSGLWLAGACAMLFYGIYRYWKLWRMVGRTQCMSVSTETKRMEENGTVAWPSKEWNGAAACLPNVGNGTAIWPAKVEVRTGNCITKPFTMGILRPRICLPENLKEQDAHYVLGHELAHVKRGDSLWKLLGFVILCVYWFHPLCWISYFLFCRDVEMACDEKATREFDAGERARYCQTILDLSYGKKDVMFGIVAFGQNGTKSRVEAILSHKKPTFWVILAGVALCLGLGIFFLTSPNSHAIGSLFSFPTRIQRTDTVYDEKGKEKEISFDLSMRKGSDGVKFSGNISFDGRTYLDAKEAIKDPKGDWSNLFFIPKNDALELWEDYIAIQPLDENMDSYRLLITVAGETKKYSSENPLMSLDVAGNMQSAGNGEGEPSGRKDDAAGSSEGSAQNKKAGSESTNTWLSGKAAWKSEGIDISNFYARDVGDILNAYVIDEDGVLWGYGENRYGQLGQGFADQKFYTERVKIAEHVIHVDYSETGFVIYLTEDHVLYGLGNGGAGTFLRGENIDWSSLVKGEEHAVCTPVILMDRVQYACCGRNDIVCLWEDGSVWTWGITGISTFREYHYVPEPVKILEGAILVTGGMHNHAALLADGSVWTWGYNYAGGCGVAEFGIVDTPTKVAENVIKVWTSRKRTNTCADYANMSPWNDKQEETTIIEKADHSFLRCGEGVGDEEKILKKYYQAVDFPMICTHEFLPCTPRNFDGTEATAEDAFRRFLSGDRTVLDPEQQKQGGFAGYLSGLNFGFPFEYVLMDLDGDGTEELFVQGGDDIGDYNGVFHYDSETGRVVSWRDDAFESDRVYLLSDETMAKRWCDDTLARDFWIIFRYLSNGEEKEIKRLVCGNPSADIVEAGLDERNYPWYEIDGVEVTKEEFQKEYEESIYNKRVTSWRNAATGEIRESGEGTGIPTWCYGTIHFEQKWLTKLEDFDRNGEEEYLTVEASSLLYGSGSILTVYWNNKAIYQYEDVLNIIEVRNYQYVDLDDDGEKELFLELLPNVNSAGMVQYLVLKEGQDGWYVLENYETMGESGESLTNSFPLKITYSDKPWEAKITCDGYDGEILVDVKKVYDAWDVGMGEIYGYEYQKAFGKGNQSGECAQIAPWGIWEIGLRLYEGKLCLVARQGIMRDYKNALWGMVDIIFDYDKTGKIHVRDMRFEYAEEYYGSLNLPSDLKAVMSDVKLVPGAYAEENGEGLLPTYYYVKIDQPSSYSFRFRVCAHNLLTDEDRAVTEWQRAYFYNNGSLAISKFDGHVLYFRFLLEQTDSIPEKMTVDGLGDFGLPINNGVFVRD